MYRFLKKILLFTFFITAVVALIEAAISSRIKTDRYAWQFEELFQPEVDAEVIILGSSKAVRGLNPAILETSDRTCYNFALNGSNPEYYFNWYTSLFEPNYKKPELIIMEVNWLMFDNEWMWRQIEHDSKYLPRQQLVQLLKRPEIDRTSLLANKLHILSKDAYKTILLPNRGSKQELIDETYHGFTPFEGNKSEELQLPKQNISIPKDSTNYVHFELLLQLFKADDIPVIFINLPEFGAEQLNEDPIVNGNLEFIQDVIKKNGFDYYDLRTLFQDEGDPNELFYNWNHLNSKGADRVSEFLIPVLADFI